jgi:hypothetical protein
MNHLRLCFIVISLVLSLSSISLAQTPQFVEGGVGYYCFNYNEDVPSPLKSSESGWLPGFRGVYGFDGNTGSFYAVAIGEYTQAKTDYDGTTQNGTSLKLTSKNTFTRGEFNLGYKIKNIGGSTFELIPYSGVGYRYWERLIGDTDPRGYREVYTWWYIPVGVKAELGIDDSWRIGCDISARIMFNGNINFDFASSDPSLNSPTAQLGNRLGVKASIPFEVALSPEFVLKFGPWYEYSAIGSSNEVIVTQNDAPVAYFQEPNSTTNQYGVDVGVKWEF